MTPERQELRDLMRSRLTDGMTPDQAADALLDLFYFVEDDWTEIDVSTLGEERGSQVIAERALVARVRRESRTRSITPDRTVTSGSA
ncbi:hypothetical protein [Micromonospora tulbaghiae]|uniref:hypothetical protein n=1 Tax=Micromonospora tulbaghiae TaxID=479978 RepID=UPI0033DBCE57